MTLFHQPTPQDFTILGTSIPIKIALFVVKLAIANIRYSTICSKTRYSEYPIFEHFY